MPVNRHAGWASEGIRRKTLDMVVWVPAIIGGRQAPNARNTLETMLFRRLLPLAGWPRRRVTGAVTFWRRPAQTRTTTKPGCGITHGRKRPPVSGSLHRKEWNVIRGLEARHGIEIESHTVLRSPRDAYPSPCKGKNAKCRDADKFSRQHRPSGELTASPFEARSIAAFCGTRARAFCFRAAIVLPKARNSRLLRKNTKRVQKRKGWVCHRLRGYPKYHAPRQIPASLAKILTMFSEISRAQFAVAVPVGFSR